MKDFKTVFTFYFLKKIRSKAFVFLTLFLCAVSVGAIVIINHSFTDSNKEVLYLVDRSQTLHGIWDDEAYGPDNIKNISLNYSMIDSKKNDADLVNLAKEDEISIIVFDEEGATIKMNVIDDGSINYNDISLLQSITKQRIQSIHIKKYNISEDLVSKLNQEISIELTSTVERNENALAIFALFLLMIIFIIMYSNAASSDISFLKTNGVMDIFSTSIRPLPLYLGVNVASGVIPFIQLTVISLSTYVAKSVLDIDFKQMSTTVGIDLSKLSIKVILVYMTFFILGYFIYALVNTALVSCVSKVEDVTSISVPIAFVALSQYFIGITIMSGESSLTSIASYVPFTSSSIMFVRFSYGYASLWQVGISMAILMVTIVVLAIIGTRLFSRGMIYFGSLKEFSFKSKNKKSA